MSQEHTREQDQPRDDDTSPPAQQAPDDAPGEAKTNGSAQESTETSVAADPLTALQSGLDEALRLAEGSKLALQRERADFINYRKRAERDLLTMRFNAKVDTLKTLLPVLDDFELATASLPADLVTDEELPAWLEGVFAIQRKLLKTLTDAGLQPLDPVGQPFDPNLHEAIGEDNDTDMDSGLVSATLQKGYLCGDRVLRPALVRVAG